MYHLNHHNKAQKYNVIYYLNIMKMKKIIKIYCYKYNKKIKKNNYNNIKMNSSTNKC